MIELLVVVSDALDYETAIKEIHDYLSGLSDETFDKLLDDHKDGDFAVILRETGALLAHFATPGKAIEQTFEADCDKAEELLTRPALAARPVEAKAEAGGWQKCPICDGQGTIHPVVGGSTTSTTEPCPTCHGARILAAPRPVPPDGLLDDAIGLLHNHEQHNDPEWQKDLEEVCARYDLSSREDPDGICMSCATALTRRNRAYICKECAEGMEEEG